MKRLKVTAALLALCVACTSSAPFVATGESLAAVGEQFVATAALMDAGLDAHSVTEVEYRAWADFGRRFQSAYPLAVQLWKSSRNVNDAATQARAAEILATLAAELATYVALVQRERGR